MSRKVDPTKSLTDDDRKYLKDRGREDMLAFADDREQFAQQRDMTTEERLEYEQQLATETKGQRTPALIDNSLVQEQIEQRQQTEEDQIYTNAGDEYDPDDVAYVNSLTVNELKDQLQERGQPTSGNKPELQMRLLNALRDQGNEEQDNS